MIKEFLKTESELDLSSYEGTGRFQIQNKNITAGGSGKVASGIIALAAASKNQLKYA